MKPEVKEKTIKWLANRTDEELDIILDLTSKEYIARHEQKKKIELTKQKLPFVPNINE